MAIETNIEGQFSRDAVYGGRLVVDQPKKGYRFSIDALLLTFFACEGRRVTNAVDLGAGSGIVGLGLLAAKCVQRVIAVELQPSLANLSVRNAKLNGLESEYQLINSDIRDLDAAESKMSVDLVTANPPFWPAFEGRLPAEEERRLACHEVTCSLEDWTMAANRAMNHRRGRFVTVFPARRLDCLIVAMSRAHLSTTRLRFVEPHENEAAELVLVEARIGQTGRVKVEHPLVLKDSIGGDTQEIQSIVSGDFSDELKSFRRTGI